MKSGQCQCSSLIVSIHLLVLGLLSGINSVNCLCGYPGRPAYGKLLSPTYTTESTYSYGETVNYACEKGYYLRGRGSRTCLNNTKWSGSIPICDSPLQIYGEALSPESIKLYPPALAVDNNPKTCFYSRRSKPREWTLDLLTKRRVTSVIITVPFASSEHYFNIFLSPSWTNNSKSATTPTVAQRCSTFQGMFATATQLIVCRSDRVEGRYLTIQDNSKAFEYFGLCEVKVMIERDKYDCGEPEKPLYSLPIETHKDDKVFYQCKEGYQLQGPTERQCLKDGSWSADQAICKEVTCPSLEAPRDGQIKLVGLNEHWLPIVMSQAYFVCDTGYQINGEASKLICLSTGNWSASRPTCTAIDCGLPRNIVPELSRFILLNGTTRFGSMALLECLNDQGLPESEVTLVCQEDGLWSKALLIASCSKQQQQDWLSSETFVKSQLDYSKSGNDNIITTLITIILCALGMVIILLIALLLKRKFYSVKLVTWRDQATTGNTIGTGQSTVKIVEARQQRGCLEHRSLGSTLSTLRKHLTMQSDLPLFGSLKCNTSSAPRLKSASKFHTSPSPVHRLDHTHSLGGGYDNGSAGESGINCNGIDDSGQLISSKLDNKWKQQIESLEQGQHCQISTVSDSLSLIATKRANPNNAGISGSYQSYQNLDAIVLIKDELRSEYNCSNTVSSLIVNGTSEPSSLSSSLSTNIMPNASPKSSSSLSLRARASVLPVFGSPSCLLSQSNNWCASTTNNVIGKVQSDRSKRQNIATTTTTTSDQSSLSPSTTISSFQSNSSSASVESSSPVDLDLTPCRRSNHNSNTDFDRSNNLIHSQQIVQVDIELPLDVITGHLVTDLPSASSASSSLPANTTSKATQSSLSSAAASCINSTYASPCIDTCTSTASNCNGKNNVDDKRTENENNNVDRKDSNLNPTIIISPQQHLSNMGSMMSTDEMMICTDDDEENLGFISRREAMKKMIKKKRPHLDSHHHDKHKIKEESKQGKLEKSLYKFGEKSTDSIPSSSSGNNKLTRQSNSGNNDDKVRKIAIAIVEEEEDKKKFYYNSTNTSTRPVIANDSNSSMNCGHSNSDSTEVKLIIQDNTSLSSSSSSSTFVQSTVSASSSSSLTTNNSKFSSPSNNMTTQHAYYANQHQPLNINNSVDSVDTIDISVITLKSYHSFSSA